MSIEIGGINSVLPFAIGRELGLPVIDGDCMGRAYPEIVSQHRRIAEIVRTEEERFAATLDRGLALLASEIEHCRYYFEVADVEALKAVYDTYEREPSAVWKPSLSSQPTTIISNARTFSMCSTRVAPSVSPNGPTTSAVCAMWRETCRHSI
jgi:glycyl-tRNA synthetase alpha subunit